MASIWTESMSDNEFSFDIKAQNVATDLVRAVSELGFTQADVAQKLNWSPSRVSRVLHGSANLTLRTLHEFATALGLEFDVVYRFAGNERAHQPWETAVLLDNATAVCKKIEHLHDAARDNLSKSEVIIESARQLNRRAWNSAKTTSPTRPVVVKRIAFGSAL